MTNFLQIQLILIRRVPWRGECGHYYYYCPLCGREGRSWTNVPQVSIELGALISFIPSSNFIRLTLCSLTERKQRNWEVTLLLLLVVNQLRIDQFGMPPEDRNRGTCSAGGWGNRGSGRGTELLLLLFLLLGSNKLASTCLNRQSNF
jgi:hypothetical protein